MADEVTDHFSQAAESFNAQDYQKARKQLHDVLAHPAIRNARTHDAHHQLIAEATFFMAESLVGLGEYASAISHYGDYLRKFGPGQRFGRQAMFRRGECAYFLKDGDRAVDWLCGFIAEYPRDPLLAHALPYLGDLTLQAGDYEQAAHYYQRALDRFPTGKLAAESQFGLARCAEAVGDIATARRRYLEMLEEADRRLHDLAGLHLGLLEYNAGDFQAAEKAFRVALRDHPSSRHQEAINYWRGLSQLAAGDYSEAAKSLDLVAIETEHALAPSATYYLGEALRMLEQFASACERYQQVRRNWPDGPWKDDSLAAEMAAALAANQWEDLATLYRQLESECRQSPRFAHARRDYARGLLRQQQFTEVIQLLQLFCESNVTSDQRSSAGRATAEDDYLLAAAYLGDRQYESALEAAERANSNAGADKFAESLDVLRASSLLGLERFAAAEIPLRRYLTSHHDGPGAARCRGHLAVSLARQGKLEAAAEMYEQYVTHHPNHDALLRTTQHLASAAQATGERNRARGWYEVLARPENPSPFREVGLEGLAWCQFVGQSEEATAVYRQYLNRPVDDPLRPQALLGLAEELDGDGQAAHAAEVLTRFLTDYTDHPRRADALYQSAWCLVDLDKWDDAKARFAELHQDPDGAHWADATYRLAHRAAAQQDFAGCQRLVERLLQASTPEAEQLKPHGLLLRGQTAAAQSQWPEVRRCMQQLVDRHPHCTQRPIADFWIAESHYREENWDAALTVLRQMAANLPGIQGEEPPADSAAVLDRSIAEPPPDSWWGMVPLRTAQIHAHREAWHDAKQIAKTILDDYPEFSQRYEVDYLLGRCAMAEADFDQARRAFRRVVNSSRGADSETAAMAAWMMGETYLHQQDYDQAIRQYSRVEIHSKFPRWQAGGLLQAGKCYEALNDVQSAIEVYARLIERFPDTQFRVDAQRRLKELTIPKTQIIASGG